MTVLNRPLDYVLQTLLLPQSVMLQLSVAEHEVLDALTSVDIGVFHAIFKGVTAVITLNMRNVAVVSGKTRGNMYTKTPSQ